MEREYELTRTAKINAEAGGTGYPNPLWTPKYFTIHHNASPSGPAAILANPNSVQMFGSFVGNLGMGPSVAGKVPNTDYDAAVVTYQATSQTGTAIYVDEANGRLVQNTDGLESYVCCNDLRLIPIPYAADVSGMSALYISVDGKTLEFVSGTSIDMLLSTDPKTAFVSKTV